MSIVGASESRRGCQQSSSSRRRQVISSVSYRFYFFFFYCTYALLSVMNCLVLLLSILPLQLLSFCLLFLCIHETLYFLCFSLSCTFIFIRGVLGWGECHGHGCQRTRIRSPSKYTLPCTHVHPFFPPSGLP